MEDEPGRSGNGAARRVGPIGIFWLCVSVTVALGARHQGANASSAHQAEGAAGQGGGGGTVVAPSGPSVPLAWVNPARCLSPCSFHPGTSLKRVNDQGRPDRRGRHRVDAAVIDPLDQLLTAARAAGHGIRISSAFRSYAEQARLFRATKEIGRAARPGHSEHQLGTAIDLRLSDGAALAWLGEHANDYGFVLSYPPGQQRLTGYRPEPWHVRFVGAATVNELRRQGGGTLEALFRSHPQWTVSGNCGDCPNAVSRRSCGRITATGACAGTVLSWCYEGALANVDCSAFNQICSRGAVDDLPDCVASGPAASAPPER